MRYNIGVILLLVSSMGLIACGDEPDAQEVNEHQKQPVIFSPEETWATPSMFKSDEKHRAGASYASAIGNITNPETNSLCSAF